MTLFDAVFSNQFVQFLVVWTVFFTLAVFLDIVFNKLLRPLAKKTTSDLDDFFLRLVLRPSQIVLILLGAYFGLRNLTFFAPFATALEQVLYLSLIIIGALLASQLLGNLFSRWLKVHEHLSRAPRIFSLLISITVYVLALILILHYYNIDITPLLVTLGFGGLAIGLALQNTLSNFFAGLHLVSDRPINVGNFVEVDNVTGFVEDIGWRSTRIRTLMNTTVIIPNSKLGETVIINHSLPDPEVSFVFPVGVAYGSDLEKTEKTALDVARQIQQTVPGAVKTFEPLIRFHEFGESNINMKIILRAERLLDKFLMTHELVKALKKRFDAEQIEISWPVRAIYDKTSRVLAADDTARQIKKTKSP